MMVESVETENFCKTSGTIKCIQMYILCVYVRHTDYHSLHVLDAGGGVHMCSLRRKSVNDCFTFIALSHGNVKFFYGNCCGSNNTNNKIAKVYNMCACVNV